MRGGEDLESDEALWRRLPNFCDTVGLFQGTFALLGLCRNVGDVMFASTASRASLVRKDDPFVCCKLVELCVPRKVLRSVGQPPENAFVSSWALLLHAVADPAELEGESHCAGSGLRGLALLTLA